MRRRVLWNGRIVEHGDAGLLHHTVNAKESDAMPRVSSVGGVLWGRRGQERVCVLVSGCDSTNHRHRLEQMNGDSIYDACVLYTVYGCPVMRGCCHSICLLPADICVLRTNQIGRPHVLSPVAPVSVRLLSPSFTVCPPAQECICDQ